MVIQVPESLRYVLERNGYEYKMAVENMVFLISLHFDDADSSWLDTEQFRKRQSILIEKAVQRWEYSAGAAEILCGGHPNGHYRFDSDNAYLEILHTENSCIKTEV